jgi:hypothetical protein
MVPVAHIAGIPVEETLGTFGPALVMILGAATISMRTRWRRLRDSVLRTQPRAHARSAPR